ncbi:MAG: oligosaccharide flippase family protein [Armatimonadota bacterium]
MSTVDTCADEANKTAEAKRGNFAVNVLANIGNFAVSMLIGLWFTPYVIHNLGVAAYGMIPLANMVASYLGLITLGLNSAVGRYITIAHKVNDNEQANRIFNTSLFGSLPLAVIVVIVGVMLSYNTRHLFQVPAGYERETIIVFLCAVFTFAGNTIGSPFEVSSFCLNRFDMRNAVNIARQVSRVGVVVLLFSLTAPRLWHIGLGMACSAVVAFIGVVWVWRVLMPELTVSLSKFDLSIVRRLAGTGGWVVINQVGALLYVSIDLIVVNRLLGAHAGGQYGAILQWSALLRSLAGVVASVFAPTMVYYYAGRDIDSLVLYSRRAVKSLGLMMALPIGLICGFSKPLLNLWLGSEFVPLAGLMVLLTGPLAVTLGVFPLFSIQLATNRVRLPGIITCVMGLLNLGLAILLAGRVGWGMYGVAAAGAIMLAAKNILFTPIYSAHILRQKFTTFYHELVYILCLTVVVSGLAWYVSVTWAISSWSKLILAGGSMGILYVLGVYRLLSPDERSMVLRMCKIKSG